MQDSDKHLFSPALLSKDLGFSSKSTYKLIEFLGRGGMGEVWKAQRISSAGHIQHVAIKFLSDLGENENSLDAEALRMSCLSHDNIVQFVDSGTDDHGRYFVAMNFVEGVDLDGLRLLTCMDTKNVQNQKTTIRIPDKIVGFILFMTLRALRYAHSYDFGDNVVGLIHRDISPGNILISEAMGFVKLADFGVAAIHGDDDSNQIVGKIPYMAPEVLLGDYIDPRVDLYSLGIVAYELLTGFNPNIRSGKMNSVIGAITEVMLSLDLPLRQPHQVIDGIDFHLSNIVSKLLTKKREERYANADQVIVDISTYLFDKGYGPTTGSLSSYFELLRNPKLKPSEGTIHSLRFLDWKSNTNADPIRPRYHLTMAAKKELSNGNNPGRVN